MISMTLPLPPWPLLSAFLLASFILEHAKPHCAIILVDPGRGLHARFSKQLVKLGFSHSQHKPLKTSVLSEPFRGQILHYQR